MKNKTQSRPIGKMECVAIQAASDLRMMMAESRTKLLEAWKAVEEEASDQETKAVLRISFAIVLDIEADKMESVLSFGVRHKLITERSIPDPNQVEMDLEPEPEAA